MCMYRVAVYTFVHGISSYIPVEKVYERVRHVYGMCHSVHDHTRFLETAQTNAGARGSGLKFFLEELSWLEKRMQRAKGELFPSGIVHLLL